MKEYLLLMTCVVVVMAASSLLASCGTTPVDTQKVKVPVESACIDAGDVPDEYVLVTSSLQPGDSIFGKAQALLLDHKGLQARNAELRALIVGCVD